MTKTGLIRYIIIDDNPIDALILKEYASAYPGFQHEGSFHSPAEGVKAVDELQPQLVFLDVEMPGATGLEVLKQIRSKIPIAVFITSHAEFAIDGFELSALDYILKPLTAERFSRTADRIKDYCEMKEKAQAFEVLVEKESLIVKEGHNQIRLAQHDIIYLEAMQDYTKLVTPGRNYLMLSTLTNLLEKLSPEKFLRVHRSYAVSIARITELAAGKLVCEGVTIPVGKTYRTQIANLNLPH